MLTPSLLRVAGLALLAQAFVAIPGRADDSATAEALKKIGARVVIDTTDPDRPITEIKLSDPARDTANPKNDTRIKGEALNPLLKDLTRLTRLDLSLCGAITDDTLAVIADSPSAMNSLQTLVLRGTGITDAGMASVAQMPRLEYLDVGLTKVGDAGVKPLTKLTVLKLLSFSTTNPLTDAGLADVVKIQGLRNLLLIETKVTDNGLAALKQVPKLNSLALTRTPITDKGLENLKSLKKLTELDLSETKVTRPGVAGLKAALPGCTINYVPPRDHK